MLKHSPINELKKAKIPQKLTNHCVYQRDKKERGSDQYHLHTDDNSWTLNNYQDTNHMTDSTFIQCTESSIKLFSKSNMLFKETRHPKMKILSYPHIAQKPALLFVHWNTTVKTSTGVFSEQGLSWSQMKMMP